ncbi:MAG: PepSY-like domain-containing protein [Bacteroidota bacterium]|nr:PepSY-like domain-containing protein [Bacteroidota bacterium]
MKTTIVTALLLFLVSNLFSQKTKESEVPKTVIDAFNTNFSGVKAKSWEKEKDGTYEVDFDLNKTEASATFNADGTLIETETEIAIGELPKAVSDYLEKNHSGKKIKEVEKIVDAEGNVKYEVEIDNKDLLFDQQGNFIK